MRRSAALLAGLALALGACEPTLPWQGTLLLDVGGEVQAQLYGRVSAVWYRSGGRSEVVVQTRGARNGVLAATATFEFDGQLRTGAPFVRASGQVSAADGRSFYGDSSGRPDAFRIQLTEVKPLDDTSAEATFEVHGSIAAELAQGHDGTATLSAAF